jgi:hypothetical protein
MITETVIFWYFFCVRISGGRTVGWGIRIIVTVAYTTGLCRVASVVPLLANGYTHSAQLRITVPNCDISTFAVWLAWYQKATRLVPDLVS